MSQVLAADPDALDGAARRLRRQADVLGTSGAGVRSRQVVLSGSWWGAASVSWADAGGIAAGALRLGADRLQDIADATTAYAGAVRRGQEALRQLDRREDDARRDHATAERVRAAAPEPAKGPDLAAAELASALSELRTARAVVEDGVATAAVAFAASLRSAGSQLLHRYADLPPLEAALLGKDDVKAGKAWWCKPKNVFASIDRLKSLQGYSRSVRGVSPLAARALGQLDAALAAANGDRQAMGAVKAWMEYQQTVSAEQGSLLSRAAFGKPPPTTGRLGSLAPARTALGKAALPLSIALDIGVLVHPPHDGAYGAADRVNAGLNAGASAAAIALASGALVLNPVGVTIVGGVLVATAVYSVGSLVYDHRKAIASGLKNAAEFYVDANLAVVHAAKDAGVHLVHAGEDVAKAVGHVAAPVVAGAKDLAGDGVHAVTSTLSGAKDLVTSVPLPGPVKALGGLLG
ncbi:MAG: hypothetical protein JWM64_510 [Frankiales bacterium]|nr:hypothetical protein [Frankiales bacterium]